MSLINKLFGNKSDRDNKEMQPFVDAAKKTYESICKLSNDGLREKTYEFKARITEAIKEEENEIIRLKETTTNSDIDINEKEEIFKQIDSLEEKSYEKSQKILDEILPEAFAVMKETAKRFTDNEKVEVTANDRDKDLSAERDSINIIGDKAFFDSSWTAGGSLIKWEMVHYDCQLLGGSVLHKGKIAEMATGEGKTLVATLPIYLNALPGKGVHVVTVNDYLAKRDSEWMGMMFEFHGLTIDCIDKHKPSSDSRRKAYLADVTYGTNNEFGFDYLRDNMASDPADLVQRKHNYAIVDEVDSVLIDDARTPLIISGPTAQGDKQEYEELKPLIQRLYQAQKEYVNGIFQQAKKLITENADNEKSDDYKEGAKLLFRSFRGLPKNRAIIKFLSEPGIKTLNQKTENFYLGEQGKNMPIIDQELYFTIEEKNNSIDLTDKGIDLISEITGDSNYYILPDIGTEIDSLEKSDLSDKKKIQKKAEMMADYSLKSERVHSVNQLLKAYALFEIDVEYVIVDNKIKIVDEQTGRIMEGRRYSDGLHQAIEAKESVKVEAATQTYATVTLQNYFRMYKKLAGMTGTAETEAGEFWDIYKLDVVVVPTNRPIVRDDREDFIFRTKKEKFIAVIGQVLDTVKEGRPVLVGTTSVETSELLSRMLKAKKIPHQVLNAKLHQKEADIVAYAGEAKSVTIATNMAGRGTDIKLGKGVIEAGGLAIIGTERHESRRVDRQLRGRAGRQGDPGSSQFFVSLEDDLMRVFGSERIAGVMDRMGLKEGEVIQHSMITKSIERAQKKVEENNFGTRKRLLEYDDVMNNQREVVYSKRRNALYGERIALDIADMLYDICYQLVLNNAETGDYEAFRMEMLSTIGQEPPMDEKTFLNSNLNKYTDEIYDLAYKTYIDKRNFTAERALPIIERVFEEQGDRYDNIALPYTDGRKTLKIVTNMAKCVESEGKEIGLTIEKGVSLALYDDSWKEHLREMDELKQSVHGAQYEQKDPLLIYKLESFKIFEEMLTKINLDISSYLLKGRIPLKDDSSKLEEARRRKTDMSRMQESREDNGTGMEQARNQNLGGNKEKVQPVKVEKTVGRNDACPCGSGKKYKHCHGK